MSFLDYLIANRADVLAKTVEHLLLVGTSVGIAVFIGIPTGILLTRREALRKPIIGFVNVIQTIPSLALFGFLIPVPLIGGIGARTAIVALSAYALLPIVRNTYEGIRGIDPAVRESGVAMGMTDAQLLREVEFPLALGVIVGGAGGLGEFIFQGISMVNNQVILAGAIPAALLALAADAGLGFLERRHSRWRRA
jgi:osmoprotectant transport system permease protein